MSSRSIEISEEVFKKLEMQKQLDETWDQLLTRLIEKKFAHVTDELWESTYKNLFEEDKEIYQKLAE